MHELVAFIRSGIKVVFLLINSIRTCVLHIASYPMHALSAAAITRSGRAVRGALLRQQQRLGRAGRCGFTTWMVSGGVKRGTVYGVTDEIGLSARGRVDAAAAR